MKQSEIVFYQPYYAEISNEHAWFQCGSTIYIYVAVTGTELHTMPLLHAWGVEVAGVVCQSISLDRQKTFGILINGN